MDAKTKTRLIGELQIALATKERVGTASTPLTRTGQIEVFKTEAGMIINEHGAELLAMLLADESQQQPADDEPEARTLVDIESLQSGFQAAAQAHANITGSEESLRRFERESAVFFTGGMNVLRDWFAGKKIVALNREGDKADLDLSSLNAGP